MFKVFSGDFAKYSIEVWFFGFLSTSNELSILRLSVTNLSNLELNPYNLFSHL